MVIALLSTGLDVPDLTLTTDEVWSDNKRLHLSRLQVANMGDDPLSPVCGRVGSECLSGLYPTLLMEAILGTPLVWCMDGDVAFSVGFCPHKTSVDNEITGWIGVKDPK
jgi:hypothetical protein